MSTNPEINIEELMQHVRNEVRIRKQKVSIAQTPATKLPRMLVGQAPLTIKSSYQIEEFLSFSDEDLVRMAYRALLRREPDAAGLSHHLSALRSGALSPPELIAQFLDTPEAKAIGVEVFGVGPVRLPVYQIIASRIERKNAYQLSEFLSFHDEDFIHSAYLGILCREPDVQGYSRYLHGLRQGELGKVDVLGCLRYSPEGDSVGTSVYGLRVAFAIRKALRLPIVGYVLSLANYLFRLPTIVRNFERFEAYEHYVRRQELAEVQLANAAAFLQTENALNRLVKVDGELVVRVANSKSEIAAHINEVVAATERAFKSKTAASQFEALTAQTDERIVGLGQAVHGKADAGALDALAAQTDERIVGLGQAVDGKADAGAVDALAAQTDERIVGLGQAVDGKADAGAVDALAAQTDERIVGLGQAVDGKADAGALDALAAQTIERIIGLGKAVDGKADAGALDALAAQTDERIIGLGKAVDGKADAGALDALAAQTGGQLFALSKSLETKVNSERHTELANHLNELLQRKADAVALTSVAARLSEELAQKSAVADLQVLSAQTDEKVHSLSQALATKVDETTATHEIREIQLQILDHKHNILDQHRRLTLLLDEARKRLPEPISTDQIERMVSEEDHLLDAFYVSFEDRFRGTREDIKQRVSVYLPIVKDAKAGTKAAPILDVGCGRGEWLQVLQEQDLIASGVDRNRVMVRQCMELGLQVAEADAITYLCNLKPNSIGALTGIHIIEHIPFKRLVALFDEVLRVLKPGGVAIFETPNPENLIVGACNFYYDPTHLNPLPPEPMRFVLESRGFTSVEIKRLHPHNESSLLNDGSEHLKQIINGMFFGAQDYSLIAYKS
jgi:SAM-dependent methyltransferase